MNATQASMSMKPACIAKRRVRDASPKMLEILKQVDKEAFDNEGQIWKDTASKVRAVIAEAEGK